MKILIVTATLKEIEPLLEKFKFQWKVNDHLYRYLYHSVNIEVLIAGVGMVSTAYLLGKTLAEQQYNYALNLGIAGSFKDNIALGEVVQVEVDTFSELGAEDGESFIPLSELNLPDTPGFFQGKQMAYGDLGSVCTQNLKKVSAITVNTVHGNAASISEVVKLLDPDIESMEGAAFFYACNCAKVDCLQIRSISNKVEPRNKDGWNIALALEELNNFAIRLIDQL